MKCQYYKPTRKGIEKGMLITLGKSPSYLMMESIVKELMSFGYDAWHYNGEIVVEVDDYNDFCSCRSIIARMKRANHIR